MDKTTLALQIIQDIHGVLTTGLIAKLALGKSLSPTEQCMLDDSVTRMEHNGFINRADSVRRLISLTQSSRSTTALIFGITHR